MIMPRNSNFNMKKNKRGRKKKMILDHLVVDLLLLGMLNVCLCSIDSHVHVCVSTRYFKDLDVRVVLND